MESETAAGDVSLAAVSAQFALTPSATTRTLPNVPERAPAGEFPVRVSGTWW